MMMSAIGHAGHDHEPHLDLLSVDENGSAPMATHVAIADGDWFDPGIWANGAVPGEGAVVHVPEGIAVSYQGASDANLFIVRVDGDLNLTAPDGMATKMVVDTMITSTSSTLVVDARAPDAGTVDIVFAEGQPAAHGSHYTDASTGDGVIGRHSWDPDQLSLGLVASGKVDIKGQEIEANAQLATGPAAGATTVMLDMDLAGSGWTAGQQIVIGGTVFGERGPDGAMQTQDEVRTITNVWMHGDKMVVQFNQPLQYDHSGPIDPTTGLELTGYVGNLSRNVTFSSEVADLDGDGLVDRGVSLDAEAGPAEHHVTERGHIMFMHNDDVTVHDIALNGLGRTDKSVAVDDVQTGGIQDAPLHADGGDRNAYEEDLDTVLATPADEITNMRGRYALHLHLANVDDGHDHAEHEMTGVMGPCPETGGPICQCGDQDADGIGDCLDEDLFDGAWIEGVAVWGSPGWGIVQHASDAVLKDNTVFDVAGSAFVAETGDETGRWEGNLAIGTYGAADRSDDEDSEHFNGDGGNAGNGFYMKSRALEVADNVAQSSARAGFFWHTEGGDLRDPATSKLGDFGVNANHLDTIAADRVAIAGFEGNTVIAARQGIRIVASPEESLRKYNDVYSHMKDFTAWEVDSEGVSVTYSSKYIFEDFLLLGTEAKVTADAQQTNAGFYFKASVADVTVLNSHVERFDNAVTNWTQVGDRQEFRQGYWDPKLPAGNSFVEATGGMGHTDGIDNAAYNLWNTNVIGLTYDNLAAGPYRVPGIDIELEDGTLVRERGYQKWNSAEDVPNPSGVAIELLGDSRDGGLVALWREDIANHPDQDAMLDEHIPLAYDNSIYLGQITREDGTLLARFNYGDYVEGINADIWSGTVLEFAKTDSLGRQVFNYGDFSPLNPAAIERVVTTNERLVFSKDEVDATLVKEGFFCVRGIDDVKFVILREQFSDRMTGDTKTAEILVALDQAWELPEGTIDGGLLMISDDMIIAPQYRVFRDGVLVEGRDAITLGPPKTTDLVMPGEPSGWGMPEETSDLSEPAVASPRVEGSDPGAAWIAKPPPPPEVASIEIAEQEAAMQGRSVGSSLANENGSGDAVNRLHSGEMTGDGVSERAADVVTLFPSVGRLHADWHDERLFGGADQQEPGTAGYDGVLFGGTTPDHAVARAGSDVFDFEAEAEDDIIVDFDNGVDAIEFMVESFGFEDVDSLREENDAVIEDGLDGTQLSTEDVDNLRVDHFSFFSSG